MHWEHLCDFLMPTGMIAHGYYILDTFISICFKNLNGQNFSPGAISNRFWQNSLAPYKMDHIIAPFKNSCLALDFPTIQTLFETILHNTIKHSASLFAISCFSVVRIFGMIKFFGTVGISTLKSYCEQIQRISVSKGKMSALLSIRIIMCISG